MATGQRKSQTTRKSTSSGRKPASSRSRSSRSMPPVQDKSLLEKFLSCSLMGKMAMPLIFIAAILVIVGIDLLLSWNDFSGFFKILGIELLVAVVVWILKLVFSKSKTSDDSVDSEV